MTVDRFKVRFIGVCIFSSSYLIKINVEEVAKSICVCIVTVHW